MHSSAAVILISNDSNRTGLDTPLMLARVLGAPALSWFMSALVRRGVSRCLLVAPERYLSEAKLCVPEGCQLMVCADRDAADPLHVFVSSAPKLDEELIVVTGPCICLPPNEAGASAVTMNACRIGSSAMMAALDEEEFSFSRVLMSQGSICTQQEGFYPISSFSELQSYGEQLRLAELHAHMAAGVCIWDLQRCYIDPGIKIGTGSILMPGTMLRGRTALGRDCHIGSNVTLENVKGGNGLQIEDARLRDTRLGNDCVIGAYSNLQAACQLESRVRVGAGCSLTSVSLGEGTQVGAHCVLKDLQTGRSCHIGAGCLTASDPKEASGRIKLMDDVNLGGGSLLVAPVTLGRGAAADAGTVISQDVAPQALVTTRVRQSAVRDWALL